jgi:hypothetical protein
MRTAFSCTCQPKRNEAHAQRTRLSRNLGHEGRRRTGREARRTNGAVRRKVTRGEMDGRTTWSNSSTRPDVDVADLAV